MADILTAADIAELRREWVVDDFEDAPEWGAPGAAKVGAVASAGALSLSLSGLGAGVLSRGARFSITAGGLSAEYAVHDDATVTAGAATVTLDRPLIYAVAQNDPVSLLREEIGMVARVFKRRQFSDVDLENFARRAEERWGVAIHGARDKRSALYSAVAVLAIDAKIASPVHYSAVIGHEAQDGGQSFLAGLEKARARYLGNLGLDTDEKHRGPIYGIATR